MRRPHKDRIEIGERIGVAAKPRERGAAIEQGIAMARDCAQAPRRNRRGLRSGRSSALKRISAIKQRFLIARPQRQRLVESASASASRLSACSTLAKLIKRVGRVRIDLQRRRHQPVGFAHLAALRLDQAEQMQRVEIIRRRLERARVEFFGFAQASLLMQAQRLLQGLRNIEGP